MIEDATEASLLQILTLVRNTVELNQHSLHFMVLTTQCEPRGPHTAKSEQEFILQIVWADDLPQLDNKESSSKWYRTRTSKTDHLYIDKH